MKKYLLGFLSPIDRKIIFLANTTNISEICYQNSPKIVGTQDTRQALLYDDVSKAKADIYKLRYHHREFLSITCMIIPADDVTNSEKLEAPTEYTLDYFEREQLENPLENNFKY